jgi:rubredoxin
MEVFGTQKNAFKFVCKICDYHTSKTSSYKQHLLSAKHKAAENIHFVPKMDLLPQLIAKKYACVGCGHHYASKSGLWKHSAKCKEKINILPNNTKQLTDLVMKLIDQNQELSKQLVELSKNSKQNC